jgi:hypothetical protein
MRPLAGRRRFFRFPALRTGLLSCVPSGTEGLFRFLTLRTGLLFALSLRDDSGYFHCVPSSFVVVAGLPRTGRDPLLNAVLLVRTLLLTRMG